MDQDYQAHLVAALEEQDREKELILQKFEEVTAPLKELSDLRAELIDRSAELHKVQRLLADHQVMLQEEREKVARLTSENAVHLCQAEDDRIRIASLLRIVRSDLESASDGGDTPLIVRPVNVHTKVSATKPSTMSLRSLIEHAQLSTPRSISQSRLAADPKLTAMIENALQAPPQSGLVAALREEIHTLNNQLDELRGSYERNRVERLTEERLRFRQQEESLVRHTKTIDHLQAMLNETTRELCLYRQRAQITERDLRGEVEALRATNAELEAALEKERCRRTADMKETLHAAASRSNDVVDRLRSLVRENELNFERKEHVLREKCQQVEVDTAKTKEANTLLKKRLAATEKRAKLEVEGLRSELNLCKQELRVLQKRVYFSYQRGENLTGTHPEHSSPSHHDPQPARAVAA